MPFADDNYQLEEDSYVTDGLDAMTRRRLLAEDESAGLEAVAKAPLEDYSLRAWTDDPWLSAENEPDEVEYRPSPRQTWLDGRKQRNARYYRQSHATRGRLGRTVMLDRRLRRPV